MTGSKKAVRDIHDYLAPLSAESGRLCKGCEPPSTPPPRRRRRPSATGSGLPTRRESDRLVRRRGETCLLLSGHVVEGLRKGARRLRDEQGHHSFSAGSSVAGGARAQAGQVADREERRPGNEERKTQAPQSSGRRRAAAADARRLHDRDRQTQTWRRRPRRKGRPHVQVGFSRRDRVEAFLRNPANYPRWWSRRAKRSAFSWLSAGTGRLRGGQPDVR